MAFNVYSTIQELLANPAARAILEKHVPGASTHPQLDQALSMTLGEVAMYPESGLNREKLQAILADLAKLA
ncbi:MAG: hypothetical protein U0350_38170 [Caldilineaceae bacterium]